MHPLIRSCSFPTQYYTSASSYHITFINTGSPTTKAENTAITYNPLATTLRSILPDLMSPIYRYMIIIMMMLYDPTYIYACIYALP